MSNLHFYAAADDVRAILDHLFASTDCRVFEAYSRNDCELREFATRAAVEDAFKLGEDPHASGAAVFLQAWSPRMGGQPVIERITFTPGAVPGHTHRYAVSGWAMLVLQFGGVGANGLTKSWFSQNTQSRATRWEDTLGARLGRVDAWNWTEATKLARVVQSHIRRMAAGKHGSRPILPHADELRKAGLSLIG